MLHNSDSSRDPGMYKPSKNEFFNYKQQMAASKSMTSTTIKTILMGTSSSLTVLANKTLVNLPELTEPEIIGPISERLTGESEVPQGRQMFSDKVKSFYFYMSMSISLVWIVAIIIIFLLRFYKKHGLINAEKERRRNRPMVRADSIPELQQKSSLRYKNNSPQYRSDSPRFRSDSPQQSLLRKSETTVQHYDPREREVVCDNPWELRQSYPIGQRRVSPPRTMSPSRTMSPPPIMPSNRRFIEDEHPEHQKLLRKGSYKHRDSYYSTPNMRDAQSKRKLFLPSISIELR